MNKEKAYRSGLVDAANYGRIPRGGKPSPDGPV